MSDDEQVRRLLADARHDEPMPEDVAARLDGVLADLRDDRQPTAPVDLAARRRRQRVRNGLLAAAAVVVVGIGANQVDWSGMSSSGDDGGSSSDVSSQLDSGAGSGARDNDAAAPEAAEAPSRPASWRQARVRLSSDDFEDEVEEFRAGKGARLLRFADGTLAPDELASGPASGSSAYAAVCGVGQLGRGQRVPARYDGERAWLVFGPVRGDSQVVDLYLCGLDAPTRSVTLPAP